jgi:C-terminal processing protease CtpA/Prc
MADLNGGNPISNGKSIALTKEVIQENPIYVTKTFDIGGRKIGYLMYNSFDSEFDQLLNVAFAELKSAGVTDLVLDLRYNGGGSGRTATYLSSMITGQFNDQVLTKEEWNPQFQAYFEENDPDFLETKFIDEIVKTDENNNVVIRENINSLNLSEVYIITTGASASASELVINGLKPYINVVTIGETTFGKYTGSYTLYDSDTFFKSGDNLNPNHKWAMQPIVLKFVNKNGESNQNGLPPTHEQIEYVSQMLPLGDANEPLLARAISLITGISSKTVDLDQKGLSLKRVFDSSELKPFGNDLYIDKEIPAELINR